MKHLLVIFFIFVGASAYGACFWTKVSEIQGSGTNVVCQWKCGWGSEAIYRTTSGFGYCPRPT